MVLLISITAFSGAYAQHPPVIKVEVSVSPAMKARFREGGRLILQMTTDTDRPPRRAAQITYGVDPGAWDGSTPFVFKTTDASVYAYGLYRISWNHPGMYYCQVTYKQNINDGREVAPGNLYSEVDSAMLSPDMGLTFVLNNVIPEEKIVRNRFVKSLVMKSAVLSKFWKRPRYLRAAILLPSGYFKHPDRTYPICYRIGGLNDQYTAVNGLIRDKKFSDWWFSGKAPQVIYVFLDSHGPYGDTYQINSANNGPCGTALTTELIPSVEKMVHYKSGAKLRFLTGYSTGGWVSLALQIFYPEMFNGAWSYSPDPVGFAHWGLANIYEDSSVYYNNYGYLEPADRTIYGEPTRSLKDRIEGESAISWTNNYLMSGHQFAAYNAAWGPKGKDGLPSLMFDPKTGRINHAIAEQWSKYDLTKILQNHWHTLGPKLQGKIWIWMGDMDGLYSNVATWFLKKYLDTTTDPKSDATIIFTPMAGHMAKWSDRSALTLVAHRAEQIENGR